jgi:serine/threonine protein kinase
MLAHEGEIIGGRYRIAERLGEGGFSEVHRGVDEVLERDVAIKLMSFKAAAPPGINQSQMSKDVTERFMKEARVVARLKDPSTITLFDFGTRPNGMLYMVLELIDGSTLRTILNAQGKLNVFSAVRVLTQTLESLREAHMHGVLHRDIKPENIMIFKHMNDPWCVRVVDFGIAKAMEESASAMTAAGILTGTLRYVPPERMNQQPISEASDLYSLGCVMHFVLTGEEVYRDSTSAIQIITSQRNSPSIRLPEDLAIPDALREVVNKLLNKDLEQRYGSAQHVLDDLELLSVELQVAKHGLGMEDVHAAGAPTQAIPAVGLGLDESSAATMQMSTADIPGLSSRTDSTVPMSMAHVPGHPDAQRTTGPGLQVPGAGAINQPDPRLATGPQGLADPRHVTAPQPLPVGAQRAPHSTTSNQSETGAHEPLTPHRPTPTGGKLASLSRNQQILIGFVGMGIILSGLFALLMIIYVVMT